MGYISVSIIQGSGTAYVSNPTPSDGEQVTIYAYPDSGQTLDDIEALDSGGHYIAVYVQQVQPFVYHDSYGSVSIYVSFSGGTPPQPTFVPAWLLFAFTKRSDARGRRKS